MSLTHAHTSVDRTPRAKGGHERRTPRLTIVPRSSLLGDLSLRELHWLERELTWMKGAGLNLHSDLSGLPARQHDRAEVLESWFAASWRA